MVPHERPNDHDPTQPPYFHPPHLPPETYTYLIQALLSLQGSTYCPPTPPYPTHPNYNSAWPANAPSSSSLHLAPQGASSSQLTPSSAVSPSTAQDPEGTEDAVSISEDKRRRNTAASARFRVKRKLRTLNLERSVAELAGRTEELEREATDLRRENAWLKEIVLLKGRNLATSSQVPSRGDRPGEDEGDEAGQHSSRR